MGKEDEKRRRRKGFLSVDGQIQYSLHLRISESSKGASTHPDRQDGGARVLKCLWEIFFLKGAQREFLVGRKKRQLRDRSVFPSFASSVPSSFHSSLGNVATYVRIDGTVP